MSVVLLGLMRLTSLQAELPFYTVTTLDQSWIPSGSQARGINDEDGIFTVTFDSSGTITRNSFGLYHEGSLVGSITSPPTGWDYFGGLDQKSFDPTTGQIAVIVSKLTPNNEVIDATYGVGNFTTGQISVLPQPPSLITTAALSHGGNYLVTPSGFDQQAYRYDSVHGWQPLGGVVANGNSTPYAVNASGTVVGTASSAKDEDGNYYNVPFIYKDGADMVAITGPGGAIIGGEATAINEKGQVAGTGNGRAFVFDIETGEFTYINNGGGGRVIDINGSGYVIGTFNGFAGFGDHGWVATKEDGFNILENLIGQDVANPDWRIGGALDINDKGQILAEAFNVKEQKSYAILLTPVPEPSTYALMALGLGVVWFLRRRQ